MKKGIKVICIDAALQPGAEKFHDKYFINWIKEGEIYTIRKVDGGGFAVLLEEVKNPVVYIADLFGKAEPRFNSKRFAPLETIEEEETRKEAIYETN